MILKCTLNEIIAAPYYSILGDEVTSHILEHLALLTRFVDKSRNIWGVILTFLELEKIIGNRIGQTILTFLEKNNIPVENMHGQGYDSASNMSSSRVQYRKKGMQHAYGKQASRMPNAHMNIHLNIHLVNA